jgi:hypothetical protein
VADDFLRSWVAANLSTLPAGALADEAKRLAAICAADAIWAGIPFEQLQAAAGGNLETYMGTALDRVSQSEIDKMLMEMRPQDAKGS